MRSLLELIPINPFDSELLMKLEKLLTWSAFSLLSAEDFLLTFDVRMLMSSFLYPQILFSIDFFYSSIFSFSLFTRSEVKLNEYIG